MCGAPVLHPAVVPSTLLVAVVVGPSIASAMDEAETMAGRAATLES